MRGDRGGTGNEVRKIAFVLCGFAIGALLVSLASLTGHGTLGPFRFSDASAWSAFLGATSVLAVVGVAAALMGRK